MWQRRTGWTAAISGGSIVDSTPLSASRVSLVERQDRLVFACLPRGPSEPPKIPTVSDRHLMQVRDRTSRKGVEGRVAELRELLRENLTLVGWMQV
jgi:hypothetical protein